MEAERRTPEPKEAPTVDGGAFRCPYCHTSFPRGNALSVCASCLARHHAACWREHGRCASCGKDGELVPRVPTKAASLGSPSTNVWQGVCAVLALGIVVALGGWRVSTERGRALNQTIEELERAREKTERDGAATQVSFDKRVQELTGEAKEASDQTFARLVGELAELNALLTKSTLEQQAKLAVKERAKAAEDARAGFERAVATARATLSERDPDWRQTRVSVARNLLEARRLYQITAALEHSDPCDGSPPYGLDTAVRIEGALGVLRKGELAPRVLDTLQGH